MMFVVYLAVSIFYTAGTDNIEFDDGIIMKTSFYLISLLCWMMLTLPATAGYEPSIKTKPPTAGKSYNNDKKAKRKNISSAQAASIVKSRYGGKVLKVQSTSTGYRVKVLKSDGRISSVHVDGTTGRIKG
ncbi:PepSY domain-containing protein [Thalassotalea atypica]|uniref:PepSY domain-containing protein n=1 Tax=Thalassotalea atypica TaxID=2054316 RepID=UPI0025740DE8|nr:hypothetical protein [Thalassotalea atypica]